MRKPVILVGLGTTLTLTLGVVGGVVAQADPPSDRPIPQSVIGPKPASAPFVNADGTVDWSKVPAKVAVAPGGVVRDGVGGEIHGPAVDALGRQIGPPVIIDNPILKPPTAPDPPDVRKSGS